MSLAHASSLLWLIPLGGAILALYLLKMRRKDLRVPATFLWPAMTYEIRANSLFQKLRISLLLILQLVAILLIVFGLSQPQVQRTGLAGEVTIVVIDTSASMSATDVSPSRFDYARKVALNIVSQARVGDRISIIEAGPVPRVVFPLSADFAGIRQAIKTLSSADSDSDVGEAMRLAVSLTAKQGSARIVLLSDGVFSEVSNFAAGDAKVVFEKIGTEGNNIAINSFGTTESTNGRLAFCGLKNYGNLPALGTLRFYSDGKLFNSMKVEVPARGTIGKTIEVPTESKVVEAKLESQDLLKADNYAVALTDPGAAVRVLLMGQSDLFVERAFALDPRVVLDRATTLPETKKYDIVVFDGVREQKTQSKGTITFGVAGKGSPVKVVGEAKQPTFLNASTTHPLMADIDLHDVFIKRSEKVQPKGNGEVVAEGHDGPWVVVTSSAQKQIYVSFQPLESDFPLQSSFPIFISNAIDYLVPRESTSNALAIEAGRTFNVPAASESDVLTLTDPDGKKTKIHPYGASFMVSGVRKVGTYTLEVGNRKQSVYSTLRSDQESNIEPATRVMLGNEEVKSAQASLRLADFWRPILLLALIVLAIEWFVFTRRS